MNELEMRARFDEIERRICTDDWTAMQVFTQMRTATIAGLTRQASAEPVAYALRSTGDDRLTLSLVFDTEDEARDWADKCVSSMDRASKPHEVVPLYSAAPQQAAGVPELQEQVESLERRLKEARYENEMLEAKFNHWRDKAKSILAAAPKPEEAP